MGGEQFQIGSLVTCHVFCATSRLTDILDLVVRRSINMKHMFSAQHRRSWLEIVDVPYLPSPAAHTMSSSLQLSSSSTPKFQPIFEQALEEYKKKTGNELTAHPLAAEINGCNSPNAILPILERKAHELNQSGSSDERLFKWLLPTTTVLHTLSVTLGESVGLVCY